MNEWGYRCVEFDMNDASKAARESRFSETELWFIRHPELPRTTRPPASVHAWKLPWRRL
jgi:hypothetical protein